jgi:hypothetical protein
MLPVAAHLLLVAALLPGMATLHLPVVAAPIVAPTVEVVVVVTATVMMIVDGVVMMTAAGAVMSAEVMTAVEIAVIGAMMVVDGVLTVHPPNMLTQIIKSARSMDTLPVIVGGAILRTRRREIML